MYKAQRITVATYRLLRGVVDRWSLMGYSSLLLALRHRLRRDVVAIMAPGSPGSLGDEAILNGLESFLCTQGVQSLEIVSPVRSAAWSHVRTVSSVWDVEDYYRSAKSRYLFRFARRIASCRAFIVLGTDVLDGFYGTGGSLRRIELAYLAARLGVQTGIVSFSFGEQVPETIVRALRYLPRTVRLCARDPLSRENAERLLQRPVDLTADLAFLLDPDESSSNIAPLLDWIKAMRSQSRLVIGINANHHLLRVMPGLTQQSIVDSYCQLLTILHEQERAAFCLIAHDSRGTPNDYDLAQCMYQELPACVREHTRIHPFPCRAAEVKGTAGYLDCAFTGRMHFAIACLGRTTPPACVTYNDSKFVGLFRHFNLHGLTAPGEIVKQPTEMASLLKDVIRRRHELREAISGQLPRIMELARRNLAWLGNDE